MLHHASLEIPRDAAGAEVAFWALLGYAEVPPPTAGLAARSRWVQDADGTCQIHLVYEDEPVIPPGAHVAIVRPDYEATLARARAAGVTVLERTPYWGSPRAFVISPAGHRVEVMAFAPR